MARKQRDEFCMICGEAPCACNAAKPAPKKVAKKVAKKSSAQPKAEPAPQVQKVSPREAMRAAARSASERKLEPERVVGSDGLDPELAAALPVLRGILHPEELARYSAVLTPQSRASAWRERNSGDKKEA